MKTIRVLLADDHTIVRAGIRSLLEKLSGVTVIGEAGDGRETLELVRKLAPDMVLMDVGMPLLNGLEVTARIVRDFPQVRVIVLSMHANEEYVRQAFQAGAAGYVLKKSATEELEQAIHTVAAGRTYTCSALSDRTPAPTKDLPASAAILRDRLTERHREILQLIAESKTTKEIAMLLELSPKTIEFHRAELMNRLKIYDIPGLVRYAIQIGLTTPES